MEKEIIGLKHFKHLSKDDQDRKTLTEYKCGYCKKEFKAYVGKFEAKGKHASISTQVKCPQCSNFLKTYNK